MQKTLLTIIAALAVCVAQAIPAIPTPLTYTQSDGSSITVKLVGDEWNSTYITMDGLLLDRRINGDFYYKTATAGSNVMAHNINERTSTELNYIAANSSMMQIAGQAVAAQQSKSQRKAPRKVGVQVPQSGSPKIPIILVSFKDFAMRNSNPKAVFEQQFNDLNRNSSLKYFKDNSKDQYTPQFDILGPVTVSQNRAYYGRQSGSDHDAKIGSMVAEAVKLLPNHDFSQYDNDGDGKADVVIILFAGPGQAQGATSDAIWPCQWSLSSAYYSGQSDYNSFKQNGVYIDKFAVFNETSGSSDYTTTIDGIGTFCHEFSHCMGLPDFYETTYANGYYGMGSWSIMNSGCYNNNARTPCAYTAYEREYLGWLNIPSAVANTKYTLPNNASTGNIAVRIYNPRSINEYYILENIQRTGWNAYAPSHGLMISHVTYSASAWSGNTVNNSMPQRMTIFPADNRLSSSSESGDLYPYNGNNKLTDTSTPAATLNTGQSYMGQPVTEITETNGIVSFWFCKNFVKSAPVIAAVNEDDITTTQFVVNWNSVENAQTYSIEITDNTGNVVASQEDLTATTYTATHLTAGADYTVKVNATYTDGTTGQWSTPVVVTTKSNPVVLDVNPNTTTTHSFLAQWNALNNVESYTLHVRRKNFVNYSELLHESFDKCTKVATTNIASSIGNYTDNTGWSGRYVYQNVSGVSLASTTQSGTITSPALDFSNYNGKVVVKVIAATMTGTNCSLAVSGGEASGVITVADNVATEYCVTLNTNAQTGQKITFTALPGKKVIIYDVKVYAGDADDVMATSPRKAVATTGNTDEMFITGITTNEYLVENLASGEPYQYRVKAFYTNGCESAWSNVVEVPLVQSITGDVNNDGVIDVDDVNCVIEIILQYAASGTYDGRDDINNDGITDVDDVNALLEIILNL